MHQPSGGDFTCGRRFCLQSIMVLLDCLNTNCENIDVSDSLLVLFWREKVNSSARKQTRNLSIKLRVLYLLSYRGIHTSPSNQYMFCHLFVNMAPNRVRSTKPKILLNQSLSFCTGKYRFDNVATMHVGINTTDLISKMHVHIILPDMKLFIIFSSHTISFIGLNVCYIRKSKGS